MKGCLGCRCVQQVCICRWAPYEIKVEDAYINEAFGNYVSMVRKYWSDCIRCTSAGIRIEGYPVSFYVSPGKIWGNHFDLDIHRYIEEGEDILAFLKEG